MGGNKIVSHARRHPHTGSKLSQLFPDRRGSRTESHVWKRRDAPSLYISDVQEKPCIPAWLPLNNDTKRPSPGDIVEFLGFKFPIYGI